MALIQRFLQKANDAMAHYRHDEDLARLNIHLREHGFTPDQIAQVVTEAVLYDFSDQDPQAPQEKCVLVMKNGARIESPIQRRVAVGLDGQPVSEYVGVRAVAKALNMPVLKRVLPQALLGVTIDAGRGYSSYQLDNAEYQREIAINPDCFLLLPTPAGQVTGMLKNLYTRETLDVEERPALIMMECDALKRTMPYLSFNNEPSTPELAG